MQRTLLLPYSGDFFPTLSSVLDTRKITGMQIGGMWLSAILSSSHDRTSYSRPIPWTKLESIFICPYLYLHEEDCQAWVADQISQHNDLGLNSLMFKVIYRI